jgi:hypothetical protein
MKLKILHPIKEIVTLSKKKLSVMIRAILLNAIQLYVVLLKVMAPQKDPEWMLRMATKTFETIRFQLLI